MQESTDVYLLDAPFRFWSSSTNFVEGALTDVTLESQDGALTACKVMFKVDYDTYTTIESGAWFHLEAENRQAGADQITENGDIEIELQLDPEFILPVTRHGKIAVKLASYLCELSDAGTAHSHIYQGYWYALNVKQEMALPDADSDTTLKVGYTTTWNDQFSQTDAPQPTPDMLEAYFTERHWDFEQIDARSVKLSYQGEHGSWTTYALINDHDECKVYSIYPQAIAEDKRAIVAEYVLRANFDMRIGNFELNLDDGELRYKTALDFEGGELTRILLHRLVDANVTLMDMYIEGVNKIIEDGISALEAIQLVEG